VCDSSQLSCIALVTRSFVHAQYRYRFKRRFDAVGFFSVATAIESFSNLDKAPFLPGAGVCIGYMSIPKEPINIGMDFALGKDAWGSILG